MCSKSCNLSVSKEIVLPFSTVFLNIFSCRNLCPNGTYSLGAQIKCTLCLPGSKCPSITEGPTICPPGSFSERNAEDCKLCEAGNQCADPACKNNLNFEKVVTSLADEVRVSLFKSSKKQL